MQRPYHPEMYEIYNPSIFIFLAHTLYAHVVDLYELHEVNQWALGKHTTVMC